MIRHSRPHFSRTTLASCALVALLGLFALAPATGLAATAAADQYSGGGNAGQGGGGNEGTEDNGASAGEAQEGTSGGGSLAFTGYPLTPLIVVVASLMAVGFAVRFGSRAASVRRQ